MRNSLPLVSVTIPTLNSKHTIEKTLQSVISQTYPNIEIVVADGGSTDRTISVVRRYKAKICFARELGRARFEAARKGSGKYVLALDSDQILGKNTIRKCVRMMESGKYDALILNEQSIVRRGTLVERLLAYDKWMVNAGQDADPIFGASIPRFFLRSSLSELQWPKTLSILDDAVLYRTFVTKAKWIGFVPGLCIRHYEVNSWKLLFKKFIRYGKLYLPTMSVSPKTTVFHSLPRRVYFSQRALAKPNLFFGLILLYGVKSTAIFVGILVFLFHSFFLLPRKVSSRFGQRNGGTVYGK